MNLHRSSHSQPTLETAEVIVGNILPDHTDQSRPAGEAPAIVALPLEDAPKSLHGAVVRTLSHPGHALSDARRSQLVMEDLGSISTATVTVEQGMDAGICF